MILHRHLLGPEMLLCCNREPGTCFDRRIIGYNHTEPFTNFTGTCNPTTGRTASLCLGCFVVVIGYQSPALPVALLATITQSRSQILPVPVITPPDGQPPSSSYIS